MTMTYVLSSQYISAEPRPAARPQARANVRSMKMSWSRKKDTMATPIVQTIEMKRSIRNTCGLPRNLALYLSRLLLNRTMEYSF